MVKYILQRIGFILLTTFIILSLTFILIKMLPPDDPGGQIDAQLAFWNHQVALGYYYEVDAHTGQLRGADKVITDVLSGKTYYYNAYPIMTQYWGWLKSVVTRWDWGASSVVMPGKDTTYIIGLRLPTSMKLNFVSIFISIPLGFIFGIWAALKKNKMTDHIISTLVMVFVSIPSFVLISFLIITLGYKANLLPTSWPDLSGQSADPSLAVKAYVIPVAALCFGTIAGFTRYMRAELCEVMSSEFLLLARTKGLTKPQTVIRHALRNSMVPIVPMIIGEFVGILGGSMVLEQLYRIPGIGNLFVSALTSKDYNVIMADMALYTVIGLSATLLVDLSYGIVDPRIRMGAVK